MGWKELLEKLKLVDIQGSLEGEQIGIVNVKIENHNYHFTLSDTDPVLIKKFKSINLTPEMEKSIKDEVGQKLKNVNASLNAVSGTTRNEMLIATTTSTSLDFIKKL